MVARTACGFLRANASASAASISAASQSESSTSLLAGRRSVEPVNSPARRDRRHLHCGHHALAYCWMIRKLAYACRKPIGDWDRASLARMSRILGRSAGSESAAAASPSQRCRVTDVPAGARPGSPSFCAMAWAMRATRGRSGRSAASPYRSTRPRPSRRYDADIDACRAGGTSPKRA